MKFEILKAGHRNLISLRLNLVKDEMKFEIRLLLGSEKKIDHLTLFNTKYFLVSKIVRTFAV